MDLPIPRKGLVIRYAYVWHHEYQRGQREGTKDRPAVVIAAVEKDPDQGTMVTVMPITHNPPGPNDFAVEIPAATCSRLGLSDDPQWVIVQERNTFRWPGPDLRRTDTGNYEYGTLPNPLTSDIIDAYRDASKAGPGFPVFRPPD